MSKVSWFLIHVISRLLEPREREAVQGDFVESRETGGRALVGLFGLVLRRQAAPWKDWRPWLALAGIVGPLGVLLLDASIRLRQGYDLYSWIIQNYNFIDPTLLDETGLTLRRGIPILVCRSLSLAWWSYIAGFVLGFLSGRAVWVNAPLLCLLWLSALAFGTSRTISVSILSVLLLLPLWYGLRQGLKSGLTDLRHSILLAASTTFVTASVIWMHRSWHSSIWEGPEVFASLVLSWPAWYLLVIAISRRQAAERPYGGEQV